MQKGEKMQQGQMSVDEVRILWYSNIVRPAAESWFFYESSAEGAKRIQAAALIVKSTTYS